MDFCEENIIKMAKDIKIKIKKEEIKTLKNWLQAMQKSQKPFLKQDFYLEQTKTKGINYFRKDEQEKSYHVEEILMNVQDKKNGFFLVPKTYE